MDITIKLSDVEVSLILAAMDYGNWSLARQDAAVELATRLRAALKTQALKEAK